MELQQNPLQQYFRQIKLYIKLPSGTTYYAPEVITFTDGGEIGIMPMTGKDELLLKNPDALLNGEGLLAVLTSCVPGLRNARMLLSNDIEALITAIRYATYNDSLEMNLGCPKCHAENSYKLDLQYALDHMEFLEQDYIVSLQSGLSVYVKPYAFPELLKGLHSQFESNKLARSVDNDNLTDLQRTEIFATAFKEIAITKFHLMTNSIIKLVDERNGVNVSEKKYISEFLQNIERGDIDKIDTMIEEINRIGIRKTFGAKCTKCEHEWQTEIDFNPVNFL